MTDQEAKTIYRSLSIAMNAFKKIQDNACKNSCDRPGHLKECALDNLQVEAAFLALKKLKSYMLKKRKAMG